MGQRALVTGVGRLRGIGAGIATGLADDGWDLVLSYWQPYDGRLGLEGAPDDPDQLAATLRRTGRRVELLEADLEDPDQAAGVADRAAELVGPLDALVMSHCESVDSGLLDTTVESFDRHYAVNVRATWLLIKAFAAQTPGFGRVVALTSDHYVHNLPYGATKGALDRVVLAVPRELADRGITATVLNPGPIDTGWMTDEIRTAGLAQQPSGRFGTPEDIGAVVSFLVSDAGSWINGQLLKADGGFSA